MLQAIFALLWGHAVHASLLEKIPVILVDENDSEEVLTVNQKPLQKHLSYLVKNGQEQVDQWEKEVPKTTSPLRLKRIRVNFNLSGKVGLGPIIGVELFTRQSVFWTKQ